MPVTFDVAQKVPSAYQLKRQPLDHRDILREACEGQASQCRDMLQTSITRDNITNLVPRSNGFVHAVLEAYGSHHHLRIRPDDVWLAILTQLSFYVNAHAEDLRSYFVAHQGKKRLVVTTSGDRYSVDYAGISRQFATLIHQNVVDSTLVEWILPDFTSTTWHDRTIGSMIMMSTLKAYFEYFVSIECGIPTVTLEGEKADWEEIHRRLYRLYELGDEPSVWADMLRPILSRFVDAFDGRPDVQFWEHVVHRTGVSCGEPAVNGWITAFCLWSPGGKWLPWNRLPAIPKQPPIPPPVVRPPWKEPVEVGGSKRNALIRAGNRLSKALPALLRKSGERRKVAHEPSSQKDSEQAAVEASSTSGQGGPRRSLVEHGRHGGLEVDGVQYYTIPTGSIPAGYSEVDVIVDDNGDLIQCKMVAGHVAIAVSPSKPDGQLDTLSPSAHWFMFEKRNPLSG
ncbi:hypothetical protein K466DRAFT_551519 [Polyporus arcularius HHB13444]|uniref:Uncharacterized protein n=1 Tax=Polyporus arcularius HHB13444 TaxID=1314778 RepID=A0A5C3P7Z7_9APHY|nr:hypothetical protein K466DRAFT_551519 [Polyporus arcularius HHB13444]